VIPVKLPQDGVEDLVLKDLYTIEDLKFIGYLFQVVYGWPLQKIQTKRMEWIEKWIKHAQKRLTYDNVIQIQLYVDRENSPKERKSLWSRLKG